MNWVEIVGYIASLAIGAAMLMKSLIRLRAIGFVGSLLFSYYGILIHSWPVFLMNGFIAAVHLYYLLQFKRKTELFEIMSVPNPDTPFLKRFVKFYQREIAFYFPNFSLESLRNAYTYFLFRDMVPAALFIAEPRDKETLEIVLDYVTPNYRDLKNAYFLFGKSKKIFGSKGYKRFITPATVPRKHRKYLKRMGFTPIEINGKPYFQKFIQND